MVRDVIQIKKSDQSKDLFSGYSNDQVEEERSIDVVGVDSKIKKALKELYDVFDLDEFMIYSIKTDLILTPGELDLFFESSLVFQNEEAFNSKAGFYFTELIRKSYWDGFNDFSFDFSNHINVNDILSYFIGKEENPLKVGLTNQVGDNFCRYSEHLNLSVQGDVGDFFGSKTTKSDILINGSTGQAFCYRGNNLNLIVNGNIGEEFSFQGKNINLTLDGKFNNSAIYNPFRELEDSVIKVLDEKTYNELNKYIQDNHLSRKPRSLSDILMRKKDDSNYNKLIYVNKNGVEEQSVEFKGEGGHFK